MSFNPTSKMASYTVIYSITCLAVQQLHLGWQREQGVKWGGSTPHSLQGFDNGEGSVEGLLVLLLLYRMLPNLAK